MPSIWGDAYTNLIEVASTMLRNLWRFGILSDADGDVTFGDEINITLMTIIDDKLTRIESFHSRRIASELIILYRRIIFSYCRLS